MLPCTSNPVAGVTSASPRNRRPVLAFRIKALVQRLPCPARISVGVAVTVTRNARTVEIVARHWLPGLDSNQQHPASKASVLPLNDRAILVGEVGFEPTSGRV